LVFEKGENAAGQFLRKMDDVGLFSHFLITFWHVSVNITTLLPVVKLGYIWRLRDYNQRWVG